MQGAGWKKRRMQNLLPATMKIRIEISSIPQPLGLQLKIEALRH
jgi:hypothetical protein